MTASPAAAGFAGRVARTAPAKTALAVGAIAGSASAGVVVTAAAAVATVPDTVVVSAASVAEFAGQVAAAPARPPAQTLLCYRLMPFGIVCGTLTCERGKMVGVSSCQLSALRAQSFAQASASCRMCVDEGAVLLYTRCEAISKQSLLLKNSGSGVVSARLELMCNVLSTPAECEHTNKYTVKRYI